MRKYYYTLFQRKCNNKLLYFLETSYYNNDTLTYDKGVVVYMSEEHNTNEEVEKLAETLAEGLEEETDVKIEEETKVEPETEAEVEPEAEPEAEPVAEPTEEAEIVAEPKKKLSKLAIILLSVGAAVLLALTVGYLLVSKHYDNKFFMRTTVNSIECSNMTVQDVESVLQKQVEQYVLTIVKSDGSNEQIKATDIDMKYVGYEELKTALSKQNPYLWPKSLFSSNQIQAQIVYEYDKEKLETIITELECMKTENQVAAVPAKVVYEGNQFVIKDEVAGTQIDVEKFKTLIHESVLAMKPEFNIGETGCYLQPAFTKDSPEVIQANETANSYLNAEIQFSYDNIQMSLKKDTFASWISVGDKMAVTVSTDKAKTFAQSMAAKYNTPSKPAVFTKQDGTTVSIPNATPGRTLNVSQETEQIVKEIKAGQKVTREPFFSNKGTGDGTTVWGTTYVEVDLTKQHMWFVKNGKVEFESDVVTGEANTHKETPTGVFNILEKIPGKYLYGNIMPNGKREYITWVNYWVRVTWSGIGFHDATWQAAFGGERYKQGYGSHGCINMPLDAVRKFYDFVYVGCPVVIHK